MDLTRSVKSVKNLGLKRSSSMPDILPPDLGPEKRRGPNPPIRPNVDVVAEVGLLDIDAKLEDVIALENDTVLFECKVVQDLKPTCTWHKNGNTLQSDDERVSVIKNHEWHGLEIKHINASDQGIYTIECRHNQQYISVQGHLFVAPQNVEDGVFYHCLPYTGLGVVKHLCNTKVLLGEPFYLEARFNYSVEEYMWYKNNDVVLQDLRTLIYSREGSAFIVVSNAQPTDTGIYFVVAKTEKGYFSSFADVQVGDSNEKRQCFPIIEEYLPVDLEVVAGEDIRLVLKVLTDSNTIIRWEKNNALIETQYTVIIDYGSNYHGLILPYATESSTGEYRVILKNGQVSRGISTATNVTITPSPRNLPIVVPLRVLESAVACCGSKVTFDCIFDLTQTNYFYVVWYVGHYKVERTNSQFNMMCNGGHFILYIKKLEPSMAGDVICELRRAWPNRKSGLIKRVYARLVIVPLSMIQVAKRRPVLLGNLYDEHSRNNTSIRIRDYRDSRYFADKVCSSYLLEIVYCRLNEEGLYFGKVVRGSASYITASRLTVSADNEGRFLFFGWNEDIVPRHCMYGIEMGQPNGTFAECGITSVPHFNVEAPPIDRILIFRIKALVPPHHIFDSVVQVELLPENVLQLATPQNIQSMEAFTAKYTKSDIIIGAGSFSCVWMVQNKQDGLNYAAKVMKAVTKTNREQILREFNIMKSLCHPKLIQLIDFYESQFTYIFMTEHCWGGELFHRVVVDEYFKEVDVVGYVKQICEGLEYLHGNNIAHLDLKPDNIICMSPHSRQVKLIDFGVARYVTENFAKVMYGTPDYIAPEVIDYEPITTASDMWSLGAVTYMLLSGLLPFPGQSWQERSVNITKAKYHYNDDVFKVVSDEAKDFVNKALLRRSDGRISAKDALQHCWIKEGPPQRMKAKLLKKMRQNLKSYLTNHNTMWQRANNKIINAHRLRLQINLDDEASSSDRTSEPL